jgi:hypothetical protein
MKRLIRMLLGLVIALGALQVHAQARLFNQAELDALLAPIALYPDPLLNQVLDASLYPDEVAQAAAWSRANPQLQGDAALRTVDNTPWHPSVKALVAYPEVLARMGESPQWVADLGEAYATHGPYIQNTIQELRARAQASGYLQSDQYQQVYTQGSDIVVQPVYSNMVYVPYYNPYVVYGTWWWPAYRPVYWRPWVPRPVFVTRVVYPVRVIHHPVRVARPVVRSAPTPRFERRIDVTPFRAVPESQRRPIISSAPAVTHPVVIPRPVSIGHVSTAAAARVQASVPHTNVQPSAPVSRFSASRASSGHHR